MEVIVRRGRNLKNADWISLTDPYLKVKFRNEAGERLGKVLESSPLQNTTDPTLDFSAILSAEFAAELKLVEIQVWDDDTFNNDDFLGSVTLPVVPGADQDEWFPLTAEQDKKNLDGQLLGELQIKIRWVNTEPCSASGCPCKAFAPQSWNVHACLSCGHQDLVHGAEATAPAGVQPLEKEADEEEPEEEEDKEKPAIEEPAAADNVVRKEIRSLSPAELARYVAAVGKMMENKDGKPQTSEWFRISGYHGWPNNYCTHGKENFPGWHRVYLAEYEKALRQADKDNGNDGNIALPYWNWLDLGKGDIMPQEILDIRFPDGFFEDPNHPLAKGFSRYPVHRIRQNLIKADLQNDVWSALDTTEHWMHASTKFRGNGQQVSVESPHNNVHVAVGYPMTSVAYAGFDPIFYMHHCNVDRVYQAYLEIEHDSLNEFKSFQLRQAENGATNLFTEKLAPFKKDDGTDFMPVDTFTTTRFGYTYDQLPSVRPDQLRAQPTFVVFEDIDILAMNHKSYTLHVFVAAKHELDGLVPPADIMEWAAVPNYAGLGAVFGGKGKECHNCRSRDPFNILVDIGPVLTRLGLSRHEVGVKVITEDERGVVAPLEDTPVPPPFIAGSLFEKFDLELGNEISSTQEQATAKGLVYSGEVLQMQRMLKRLGYYGGKTDGWLGEKTNAALLRLQRTWGIHTNGVCSTTVKRLLLAQRFDTGADLASPVQEGDDLKKRRKKKKDRPNFDEKAELTYWIGTPPGYLRRWRVKREISDCFSQWERDSEVRFRQVEASKDANLKIVWRDQNKENNRRFDTDGSGGALAHATSAGITLDAGERWLTQGMVARTGSFYVKPVVLHEIGHVLGLSHSNDANDLMAPFYVYDRLRLTVRDTLRIKNLYDVKRKKKRRGKRRRQADLSDASSSDDDRTNQDKDGGEANQETPSDKPDDKGTSPDENADDGTKEKEKGHKEAEDAGEGGEPTQGAATEAKDKTTENVPPTAAPPTESCCSML